MIGRSSPRPGRARDERALTLVEMMIGLALLALVVPVLGPLMVSSMRSGGELQAQSEVVDELQLQVQAIARELRSAECIYEPAENSSGDRLRFLTTANGDHYEVTYDVADGELVRTRDATSRDVGRGLVGSSAPFAQIANPRRSVEIDLHVQLDDDQRPKELRTTVAGRNAWRTC